MGNCFHNKKNNIDNNPLSDIYYLYTHSSQNKIIGLSGVSKFHEKDQIIHKKICDLYKSLYHKIYLLLIQNHICEEKLSIILNIIQQLICEISMFMKSIGDNRNLYYYTNCFDIMKNNKMELEKAETTLIILLK